MTKEELEKLEIRYKSAIRKPWGTIIKLVEEIWKLRALIKDVCQNNGFNTHCTCKGKDTCLYCRYEELMK